MISDRDLTFAIVMYRPCCYPPPTDYSAAGALDSCRRMVCTARSLTYEPTFGASNKISTAVPTKVSAFFLQLNRNNFMLEKGI